VEFYETIAAHRAMVLNGTMVFGRAMRVDYSSEKRPKIEETNDGVEGDAGNVNTNTGGGGAGHGGFRGRGGRGGPRGRGGRGRGRW
jgi:hypothetical protein